MSRKKIEYNTPSATASVEELRAMVEVLRTDRNRLMRALVAVTQEKHQLIDRGTQFRKWLRAVHSNAEGLQERIAKLEAEVERLGGSESFPSSPSRTPRACEGRTEAVWTE
jgi:predicted RecB family endonuclease